MKKKLAVLLLAVLALTSQALAGWHATPAVDSQGRTIYVQGPGGLPELPSNASPLSGHYYER